MSSKLLCAISALTFLAAGCASEPQVTLPKPSFMSPIMYETYDCEQIDQEAKVLTHQAENISGVKTEKLSENGVIVWPVSLLSHNHERQNQDLVMVRAKFEALEKASQREKCNFQFDRGFTTQYKSA